MPAPVTIRTVSGVETVTRPASDARMSVTTSDPAERSQPVPAIALARCSTRVNSSSVRMAFPAAPSLRRSCSSRVEAGRVEEPHATVELAEGQPQAGKGEARREDVMTLVSQMLRVEVEPRQVAQQGGQWPEGAP